MNEDLQKELVMFISQADFISTRWKKGYYDLYPHMAARDIESAAIILEKLSSLITNLEHDFCIEGDYTGEKPAVRLAMERISAVAEEFSKEIMNLKKTEHE